MKSLDASALLRALVRLAAGNRFSYADRVLLNQLAAARFTVSSGVAWKVGTVVLGLCVLLGCASGRTGGGTDLEKADGVAAAQVPAFLAGPISVLWTNANDFSAHLVRLERGVIPGSESLAGNLFQQEGWLLFVPTGQARAGGNPWEGMFRFLWDVKGNRGYVISEELHGYAALQSPEHFLQPRFQPDPSRPPVEQIDDTPCERELAEVAVVGGGTSEFRVWRAPDLSNLPLKVQSTADTNSLPFLLSKVTVEQQPPSIFELPPDFISYSSAESMVREILRKQLLARYRPTFGDENRSSRRRR